MLVIDRFEGEFAVIEYEQGKTFDLPRYLLPTEAKEGDIVRITALIDGDETTKRKKRVQDLMQDLFKS